MKKIILLIDSSDFGGIESHVLQLSRLLQQKKRHFVVIFLNVYQNFNSHPLVINLTEMGIPLFYLCGNFHSFYQLLKRDKRVYLIHAHGYKATLWARMACLYYPIICLSTYHSGEECVGKVAFYQYLMYKTGFLSQNFAVSHSLASKRRIGWIPNFITLPIQEKRNRHKQLQVAFVGRNDYVKGLDRFLFFSQKNLWINWHVFGCTGVQDNVTFHGKVRSMEEYWSQLDLLIIPSRGEGLPMAALEAMSHQVPVFSTRVGELGYLLKEAWTVEESEWRDLLDKITDLANAPDEVWKCISSQVQEIIKEDYLPEHFWKKIVPYYQVSDNALLK